MLFCYGAQITPTSPKKSNFHKSMVELLYPLRPEDSAESPQRRGSGSLEFADFSGRNQKCHLQTPSRPLRAGEDFLVQRPPCREPLKMRFDFGGFVIVRIGQGIARPIARHDSQSDADGSWCDRRPLYAYSVEGLSACMPSH